MAVQKWWADRCRPRRRPHMNSTNASSDWASSSESVGMEDASELPSLGSSLSSSIPYHLRFCGRALPLACLRRDIAHNESRSIVVGFADRPLAYTHYMKLQSVNHCLWSLPVATSPPAHDVCCNNCLLSLPVDSKPRSPPPPMRLQPNSLAPQPPPSPPPPQHQ